jgi:hypothetical protein
MKSTTITRSQKKEAQGSVQTACENDPVDIPGTGTVRWETGLSAVVGT